MCTPLILGLPGEGVEAALASLERVLKLGAEGLKLHPLHVVRHTRLAQTWRRGGYFPLTMDAHVDMAADLVERTPSPLLFHRLTGTASADILRAPDWRNRKWAVLNPISRELARRNSLQGAQCGDRGPVPEVRGQGVSPCTRRW